MPSAADGSRLAESNLRVRLGLSGATPGLCVEFATAAHERTLHSRADPLTQSQIRWSVRLHFHAHHRNGLLQLAEALLYAEQNATAHEQVLGSAFTPTPTFSASAPVALGDRSSPPRLQAA